MVSVTRKNSGESQGMNLFKSIKPWEIKKKKYQNSLRVTDLENVMLCVQILLVNHERKKICFHLFTYRLYGE